MSDPLVEVGPLGQAANAAPAISNGAAATAARRALRIFTETL
jgi:hypothetical protein